MLVRALFHSLLSILWICSPPPHAHCHVDVCFRGLNHLGQLGDGSGDFIQQLPVTVAGLSINVSSVTAGVYHSCAVTINGAAMCWYVLAT